MPEAMVAARESDAADGTVQQCDVAVVGAGFAGLYLLHRLRKAGLSAVGLEEAEHVPVEGFHNLKIVDKEADMTERDVRCFTQ